MLGVSSSSRPLAHLQLTISELQPTYPDYKWFPEALANASHSSEHLAVLLYKYITSSDLASRSVKDVRRYISTTLVQDGLGIQDATNNEIDLIADHPEAASYLFADMVSRRAQIGWSTHGHSAVDVNIYGSAGSEALRGNHENTEIGEFLRNYLDADVDAITKELKEKAPRPGNKFHGVPSFDEDVSAASDHYKGLMRDRHYPQY